MTPLFAHPHQRMAAMLLISGLLISSGCQRQPEQPIAPTTEQALNVTDATDSAPPAVAALTIVSTIQQPNLPVCQSDRCIKMSIQHVKTGQPWLDEQIEATLLKLTDVSVGGKKHPNHSMQQNIERFIQASQKANPSEMVITTELIQQQGAVAVFRLVGNYYLGGAHGSVVERYLNVDLNQKKILKLSDVLQDEALPRLETLLYERYREWVGQNAAGQPIDAYESMFPFKVAEQWYLGKKGMVFAYGQADIGPYSAGLAKFELPYTELTTIIRADFLPALNDDPIAVPATDAVTPYVTQDAS